MMHVLLYDVRRWPNLNFGKCMQNHTLAKTNENKISHNDEYSLARC